MGTLRFAHPTSAACRAYFGSVFGIPKFADSCQSIARIHLTQPIHQFFAASGICSVTVALVFTALKLFFNTSLDSIPLPSLLVPASMPIQRIFLTLLLSAATALAFAQSEPRAIQEEDKYVRPLLIVPPVFPKLEPSDKLPVEIRMSGSVNVEGVLEAPDFSPIEGNEKFIAAIKDVLNLWRFRPAIGKETCMPVVSTGVVLVWFEEKNGMPSVSVSMPKRPSASGVADAKPKYFPRVFLNRPKVEYPFSARRAGMEGFTELLFHVDHQGEALQTTVLFSIPSKIFGDAAIAGSRRVRFSAGAPDDDAKKNVCILVPFKYCLNSGASYPLTACR